MRTKQFIYGRFRADAFNLPNVGYGLLTQSPGLDPLEIEKDILPLITCRLDATVRYWNFQKNLDPMYLFGRLPDGRFLISSLLIRQNIELLDSSGRDCPIYHVHVVPEAEMQQVGYNPFRIIDSGDAFVSAPEDLGEFKERISEGQWIDVSVTEAFEHEEEWDWSENELKKLLDYRLRPIKVGGSQVDTFEFIRQIYATSMSRHMPLYFTTMPDQENRLDYSFVVGSRDSSSIFVDTTTQTVNLPKSMPQAGPSTSTDNFPQGGASNSSFFFDSWLKTTAEKSWKQCMAEFATAQMLDRISTGKWACDKLPNDDWDEMLIGEYWKTVAAMGIRRAVRLREAAGVSADFARAIVFRNLRTMKTDLARIKYTHRRSKLLPLEVLQECYQWLRVNAGAMDRFVSENDWLWIAKTASELREWGVWLMAITVGAIPDKVKPRVLDELSQAEIVQLLHDFPQISVKDIWRRSSDFTFVVQWPAEQWTDDELLELLQRMDQVDQSFCDQVLEVLGLRISVVEPARLKLLTKKNPMLNKFLPKGERQEAKSDAPDPEEDEQIREAAWLRWPWRKR